MWDFRKAFIFRISYDCAGDMVSSYLDMMMMMMMMMMMSTVTLF